MNGRKSREDGAELTLKRGLNKRRFLHEAFFAELTSGIWRKDAQSHAFRTCLRSRSRSLFPVELSRRPETITALPTFLV